MPVGGGIPDRESKEPGCDTQSERARPDVIWTLSREGQKCDSVMNDTKKKMLQRPYREIRMTEASFSITR